jgi:hypothetical protein
MDEGSAHHLPHGKSETTHRSKKFRKHETRSENWSFHNQEEIEGSNTEEESSSADWNERDMFVVE